MIPNFEKLIATIRSREISACVILQAQSQLKAIYKDNMDTIIGNMDTTLFLGGKEKTTLEEISKMLGKETIDMFNTGESRGQSPSYSRNFQKLGKDLMSVDEIGVMDGSRCILQIRGERPFFSHKYDITRHKNYRYLADSDKKHTFNIEQYLSTKLKLKPGDEYDVIEIDLSDEPPE
jgi:type IV secretion system protein VirD4